MLASGGGRFPTVAPDDSVGARQTRVWKGRFVKVRGRIGCAILMCGSIAVSACGASDTPAEKADDVPLTTSSITTTATPSVSLPSVEIPSAVAPGSSAHSAAVECVIEATEMVLRVFDNPTRAGRRTSVVNGKTVIDYELLTPGQIISAHQISGPLLTAKPGDVGGSSYYFQVGFDRSNDGVHYSLFGAIYNADEAASSADPIKALLDVLLSGSRSDVVDNIEIGGDTGDVKTPGDVSTDSDAGDTCAAVNGDGTHPGFIRAFQDQYR